MNKFVIYTVLLCTVVSSLPAQSMAYEPLHNLVDAARNAIATTMGEADYRLELTEPDPRLTLVRCEQALDTHFTHQAWRQGGRLTVGVSCQVPRPWKVYLTGQLRLYRSVWVLTRGKRRGERIMVEDIKQEKREVSRLSSKMPDNPVGLQLTRNLGAGVVLAQNHLTTPTLIQRGDPVTILSKTEGFSVRMTGAALAHGKAGQRIDVRNRSSGRTISARVEGIGLVVVP
ncbi:MAG: flagellar basal body P-ring formation chaperone FlgA [Methylococcales bacterium]|nr:flagellar basal body P-ring formation chaperone FlgA [Methylococcales bacterium]